MILDTKAINGVLFDMNTNFNNTDQLIADYQSGMSISQLVKKYKTSKQTVNKIFQSHNVTKRIFFKTKKEEWPQIYKKYADENLTVEQIAGEYGCTVQAIYNILSKFLSLGPYRDYAPNESFFSKIDTESKAYILGFIWADGHVRHKEINIQLSAKDCDILEKIRDIIFVGIKPSFYTRAGKEIEISGKKSYRNPSLALSIYSTKMVADLEKLGCGNGKSTHVNLPSISDSLFRHFLRGFFDGDGGFCIRFRNETPDHAIDICVNKEFGKVLQEKIKQLIGVNAGLYRDSKTEKLYHIKIGGKNQFQAFIKYIYKDSEIYLDRKYKQYVQYSID